MRGFYWLIEGALAGTARLGTRRGQRAGSAGGPDPSAASAALDEDLAFLRRRGVGAVLSLTETPLADGALARHGMEELHLAVDDLTPPSPLQLEQALEFIDRQRSRGRAVAVHCLVGEGRTGTVLAAYLIRGGLGPEEALREVRAVCPNAVGAAEQERALHDFARCRDWMV